MEKDIAILMADLSGYTALTETHGSAAAADLIDRYIEIAENSLVGDCRLHERTGDEIMIVSSSPDSLLETANKIRMMMSGEEYFLQVHGGMHYGKVLKRANGYFGSAINLTARIAAKANAGKFWCSSDFVNALSEKDAYKLTSKGNYNFKNISEEKEVFELEFEYQRQVHIDPVCRMLILEHKSAVPHPVEGDLYFCSPHCLRIHNSNKRIHTDSSMQRFAEAS